MNGNQKLKYFNKIVNKFVDTGAEFDYPVKKDESNARLEKFCQKTESGCTGKGTESPYRDFSVWTTACPTELFP